MRLLAAALLMVASTVEGLVVRCPSNCTAALQAALLSGAAHVRIEAPADGSPATIGSPHHSTRILANGTDQVVEFADGLCVALLSRPAHHALLRCCWSCAAAEPAG